MHVIGGMHVVSVTAVSKLYTFFMTGILAVREFEFLSSCIGICSNTKIKHYLKRKQMSECSVLQDHNYFPSYS